MNYNINIHSIKIDALDVQIYNKNIYILTNSGSLLSGNLRNLFSRLNNEPNSNEQLEQTFNCLIPLNSNRLPIEYKVSQYDDLNKIINKIADVNSFPVDSGIIRNTLIIGEEDCVESINLSAAIGEKNKLKKHAVPNISNINVCDSIMVLSSEDGLHILNFNNKINLYSRIDEASSYSIMTPSLLINVNYDGKVKAYPILKKNNQQYTLSETFAPMCVDNSILVNSNGVLNTGIDGTEVLCHFQEGNKIFIKTRDTNFNIYSYKNKPYFNTIENDAIINRSSNSMIKVYNSNYMQHPISIHKFSKGYVAETYDKVDIYIDELYPILTLNNDEISQVRTYPNSQEYGRYIIICASGLLHIIEIQDDNNHHILNNRSNPNLFQIS